MQGIGLGPLVTDRNSTLPMSEMLEQCLEKITLRADLLVEVLSRQQ